MRFDQSKLVSAAFILIASLGSVSCATGWQGADSGHLAEAIQPSAADQQLAAEVQEALHSNPYFYDRHVTVSIEHGDVVLRGFVSDGRDLINAKRIAVKAAGGRRVVDDLSINPIEEPTRGDRR